MFQSIGTTFYLNVLRKKNILLNKLFANNLYKNQNKSKETCLFFFQLSLIIFFFIKTQNINKNF